MATPTKADPLYERMVHAFGDRRVDDSLLAVLSTARHNILDLLTDEARDELVRRCISSHKLSRKFAAESRKHHREKQRA